jgi:transcriptional regulator with XRE-family HTH domain
MPTSKVFCERLQKLRERRRISRIVLSELCGLAPDAVRRYERGEAEPKLKALIALADYFEITIDFLVGHEKDR